MVLAYFWLVLFVVLVGSGVVFIVVSGPEKVLKGSLVCFLSLIILKSHLCVIF